MNWHIKDGGSEWRNERATQFLRNNMQLKIFTTTRLSGFWTKHKHRISGKNLGCRRLLAVRRFEYEIRQFHNIRIKIISFQPANQKEESTGTMPGPFPAPIFLGKKPWERDCSRCLELCPMSLSKRMHLKYRCKGNLAGSPAQEKHLM